MPPPVISPSPGPTWRFSDVVSSISSGLRADAAGSPIGMNHRYADLLTGRGVESLRSDLDRLGVPIRPPHLEDEIYQTSDPNRSIVELISNALDSGSRDVHVTVRDGAYEVVDSGCGMSADQIATRLLIPKLSGKPDPSKQNGRFGIGFYTVLRHLKTEGDSVVVETRRNGLASSTSRNERRAAGSGETGYRLTFSFSGGEIRYRSEEAQVATGTRVCVTAAEIREGAMEGEINRYLRYVDSGRSLLVNGKKANEASLRSVAEYSFGNQKAGLSTNPEGSGVCIRVGEIIVEQYFPSGQVPGGEWVISLPQGVDLSITRDLVQVDEPLVSFLEKMVLGLSGIDQLNLMVPLFESLEKRNPPRSLIAILRQRARDLVAEMLRQNPALRIYPDQAGLELMGGTPRLLVHPTLFAEEWWGRFAVPREFQWGEMVNGGGPGHPVRLVVSEEIGRAIHFDPILGVVYLNKRIYDERATFLLSALFLIPNLRFRIQWGEQSREAARQTFGADPETAEGEKGNRSGARELEKFLQETGLSLSDLSLKMTGIIHSQKSGGHLGVTNIQGQHAMVNHRGEVVLGWGDKGISCISDGAETIFGVVRDGKFDVIDRTGQTIFTFEDGAWNIDADFLGDEPIFIFNRGSDGRGVVDRRGRQILPFEYQLITLLSYGEEPIFQVLDGSAWSYRDRNGREIPNPGEMTNPSGDELDRHDEAHDDWVKIYPLHIDDAILVGRNFISIARSFRHDKTLEILPYSAILQIARDPDLRVRLEQVRENLLQIAPHLFAIVNSSQEVWDRFIQEVGLRPHLRRLSHPLVARYADSHRDQKAPLLIRGLKLVERFNYFARPGQEEEFFQKIDQILRSRIDTEKLLRTLDKGGTSRGTEAVRLYLSRPGAPLLQGEVKIAPLSSRPSRLADVITKIRLNQTPGLGLLKNIPNYGNEQDERDLNHAIHHLNVSNPYAFVRELLQNSLDAQKTPPFEKGGPGGIFLETYESQGRLIVSISDQVGMTEADLIGLLDPGEGTKRGRKVLGGFGVGFYSTLAEANWVRLKTAVNGSSKILSAEFLVDRDERGKILDIRLRVKEEKRKKRDDFFGTIVETERYADLPQIEAARLEATIRNLTRYISPREAEILYNGSVMNRARPDPLVIHEEGPLGRIELHDGLENRILLGGLPLTDLPKELWEEVPEGIREFFSRLGFYLNLDPQVVKTTPTRDRFREPAIVLPELENILPGLLVRGFLERVANPHYRDDLHHLPEVYFSEVYELASTAVLGVEIIEDAERLNSGRYGEVDYEKYARGEEGERRLLKLLTLIRFIPTDGGLVSLKNLNDLYRKATGGNKKARSTLNKLLQSEVLPQSVRSRLSRAEGTRDYAAAAEDALSGRTDYQPERLYRSEEIEDPAVRRYLDLLREVTVLVYRHYRGEADVTVGLHTQRNRLGAYAYHFTRGEDYYLYRSFGPRLDRDVQELAAILADEDSERSRKNFDSYLAKLFQVVSHELTHVLTERPETPDFTHDPLFYQNQMEILTAPELPKNLGEELFENKLTP